MEGVGGGGALRVMVRDLGRSHNRTCLSFCLFFGTFLERHSLMVWKFKHS